MFTTHGSELRRLGRVNPSNLAAVAARSLARSRVIGAHLPPPAADGGILDSAASNIHSIEKWRDGRLPRGSAPRASISVRPWQFWGEKKRKKKEKLMGKRVGVLISFSLVLVVTLAVVGAELRSTAMMSASSCWALILVYVLRGQNQGETRARVINFTCGHSRQ